jgi:single-stranded-DNA-specific exonuclease
MEKHWSIRPHEPERIAELERAAGVPWVVAQLLICRGIDSSEVAHDFLSAKLTSLRDPRDLPGASDAARLLAEAVQRKQRIVVYGDYDADGMTGTAILLGCLKMLGADVTYYVPNRLEEGYGLSEAALEKLAKQGAEVVISVDCGIASIGPAEKAKELGLQLIITDHHRFAESLPVAAAIVHPQLPGHDYPFAGLCGAGVALKVAWELCRQVSGEERVPERMRNFLMQAIGLAAIGTVADVVPLLDENRIIVRHGLLSLHQRPPLGLARLMKVTGLDKKSRLTCEDIGFMLAPRLNAAGRLGQAQLAVELLTTTNAERADALAEYIHQLNSSRDSLDRSVYRAANKQAKEEFDLENDSALVLAGRGWHPGVIGIVAGRLAEKYHRPVVLISLDELGIKPGSGSARGVKGIDLHATLQRCSDHLLSHGGHAAAAGLKIEEKNLDRFREEFCELIDRETNGAPQAAELRIDAEAPLSALSMQTVSQIEQLAPFGEGNPRPLLCTSDVRLAEPPKPMGGGGRHLSLKVVQHNVTMRAVAFGRGDWADKLTALDAPLSIAYRPVINEFRGRRTVELHLVDWRVEQSAATC